MIGEIADEPPFSVGELGTLRAPSCRFLALAHGGQLQSKDAAKLGLVIRMGGEKGVGTIDQHAAKLERLRGETQHPVAPPQHLRPHVVQRVGQQR
jgi:hypothetical protein